tara:strand:- start:10756 stop:10911 length:156 start_codon:yes stop_codon:yes gene_type:complete
MSFREYVNLNNSLEIPKVSLENIIKNHVSIALEIKKKVKPLKEFDQYLEVG